MKRPLRSLFLLLVVGVLAWVFGPGSMQEGGAPTTVASSSPSGSEPKGRLDAGAERAARPSSELEEARASIGFRSRAKLDEHFEQHGREFGSITKEEYLRLARELRDARVGGDVLEIVRDDGVVSRFHERSGAFIAFDRDGTIRTFFKPNDGARYFERQARKEHE